MSRQHPYYITIQQSRRRQNWGRLLFALHAIPFFLMLCASIPFILLLTATGGAPLLTCMGVWGLLFFTHYLIHRRGMETEKQRQWELGQRFSVVNTADDGDLPAGFVRVRARDDETSKSKRRTDYFRAPDGTLLEVIEDEGAALGPLIDEDDDEDDDWLKNKRG